MATTECLLNLTSVLFCLVVRLDRLKVEQCGPQEVNHVTNHQPPLTQPEIQNNERNREVDRERAAAVASVTLEEDRKQRDAERYGFQKDGAERDRPLTKINSIKLQPAQAAAVTVKVTSAQTPTEMDGSHRSPQVNGAGEQSVSGAADGSGAPPQRSPNYEADRTLSRTSSMQQLEQWVRTQRGRNQDDDTRRWVRVTAFTKPPCDITKFIHTRLVVPKVCNGSIVVELSSYCCEGTVFRWWGLKLSACSSLLSA